MELVKFDQPIHLSPAVDLRPGSITASVKASLNVTVGLPCGPLRLRKVEFLVIDQDMDDVLLGRPLLKYLGFNLETNLETVRHKYNNADISYLMAHPGDEYHGTEQQGKAAAIAPYTGLW